MSIELTGSNKVTAYGWGRAHPSECRWATPIVPLCRLSEGSQLARGLGRSYGDSNLNTGGTLLSTRALDRFISFNQSTGVLRAQAGVSLHDIIAQFLPRGWFLPVTPGSRFVSLGGAVANDVHGKNHHLRGSIGNHIRAFELVRSDGLFLCTLTQNSALFNATLGGLGLTGFINWVELQLMQVSSSRVDVTETRFTSLDDFYKLDETYAASHEYTVAWFDCLSYRDRHLRGIYTAGNHATGHSTRARSIAGLKPGPTVPFAPPISPINKFTLSIFNAAYSRKPLAHNTVDLIKFMYPLDAIGQWNRIYGKRGFYQYQCVVPVKNRNALDEMLNAIQSSGQGSFLAVLKRFGDSVSPGLLSFPTEGYTLALDFPNRGEKMLTLFNRLNQIVRAANGRLYPAKDGAMPGEFFRESYPQWTELEALRDPAIMSDFWKRVTS